MIKYYWRQRWFFRRDFDKLLNGTVIISCTNLLERFSRLQLNLLGCFATVGFPDCFRRFSSRQKMRMRMKRSRACKNTEAQATIRSTSRSVFDQTAWSVGRKTGLNDSAAIPNLLCTVCSKTGAGVPTIIATEGIVLPATCASDRGELVNPEAESL